MLNTEVPLLHVRHPVVAPGGVLGAGWDCFRSSGGKALSVGFCGRSAVPVDRKVLTNGKRVVPSHMVAFPRDVGAVEDGIAESDRGLLSQTDRQDPNRGAQLFLSGAINVELCSVLLP